MTRPRATTLALGALMVVASACGTQTAGSGDAPVSTTKAPSASIATPSTTSTPSNTPTPSPTPTEAVTGRVYWEDLEPGMCIYTKKLDNGYDFWVVPCTKKHDREVLAVTSLPGTTKWPGDRAVSKLANTACRAAFKKYVGVSYNTSDLEVTFYTTDKEGWQEKDRTALCLVFDPDHPTTTHALKGSKK